MIITTTAVAFIILSLGLAFCGWRFFKAFQKRSDPRGGGKTGLLLSFSFLATSVHNGILGFGALFFARNSEVLYFVSITAHFFLTLFAIIALYTLYYIFFRSSPYFSITVTIILSTIGLMATLNDHSQPFLTSSNGIDWNMNFLSSLSTWYLLFIGISAFFYIFFHLFRATENKEIKILSFIISVTAIIGLANVFVRLVILYNAPTSICTSVLDVGTGIIGMLFIMAFIIGPLIKNWIKKPLNKVDVSNLEEKI